MHEENIERRHILAVDDERGIVEAVRRELSANRTGRYSYDIETFTSPLAALERAKSQDFAVVLSDYRMPEMDGLTFLKALSAVQPDCVRIVLSGQTDFDALIRMINETHIYRFIPKPWNAYFLKSSILQAIRFHDANIDSRRMVSILQHNGVALPASTTAAMDRILVVDSSINVGQAVARSLTQYRGFDTLVSAVHGDVYEQPSGAEPIKISVDLADSAAHALKMAEGASYSCIIVDYAMRGMEGGDFLTRFLGQQPDCATVILSRMTDLDNLITVLDLANIYAFIPKPWEDYDLTVAVTQALIQRRLFLGNRECARVCKERGLDASTDGGVA